MTGKLYYKWKLIGEEEIRDRNIVDILTTNDARTSLWASKEKDRIVADIIGINSVCQGVPVRLYNGWYERGFVDPKNEDVLYLIDVERKIVGKFSNKINLFYDQDKVNDRNRFEWTGNFQDIIDEFKEKDYKIGFKGE